MPHLVRSLALAALSFGVALSALSATPPPLSNPNVTPEAAQGVAYYGALDGGATVSAGGNAAYSIPITVPPGRRGLTPSLSINYNSNVQNGMLGLGWFLSGGSRITRCPKTISQDGVSRPVRYDLEDRYCLDGHKLVAVSGTYGAAGTLYRTEIDQFSSIKSIGTGTNGPTSFTVKTKGGLIMEYGGTSDSRVEGEGSSVVRTWALNRVEDALSNHYVVNYTENNANGRHYISEIAYNPDVTSVSGGQPNWGTYQAQVLFDYESRPDNVTTYEAGSRVQRHPVRLSGIRTKESGNLVTEYKLTYETVGADSRSRLTEIERCDAASNCQEPIELEWWHDGTVSHTTSTMTVPYFNSNSSNYNSSASSLGFNNNTPRWHDINGDGRPDYVHALPNSNGAYPASNMSFKIKMSQPGGSYSTETWSSDIGGHPSNFYWVDIDGDGQTDIVKIAANTGDVDAALAGTSSFSGGNPYDTFSIPMPSPLYSGAVKHFLADMNGDGLIDIVQTEVTYVTTVCQNPWTGGWYSCVQPFRTQAKVFRNKGAGQGFHSASMWISNIGSTSNDVAIHDLTGDGLKDLVIDGRRVWANDGTKFETTERDFGATPNGVAIAGFVDVNGDGMLDRRILKYNGACCDIQLNTGTTFVSSGNSPVHPSLLIDDNRLADGYTRNHPGRWVDSPWFPRNYSRPPQPPAPGALFTNIDRNLAKNDVASAYDTHTTTNTNELLSGFMQWADVDGDGLLDLSLAETADCHNHEITGGGGTYHKWRWYYCETDQLRVLTANGHALNVLKQVTQGNGVETVFTYKPLSDSSVYTKGTSAVFPDYDIQDTSLVVSRMTQSNGIGGVSTVDYTYEGLIRNVQGRGELGYAKITATNVTKGSVTTTEYAQQYPYSSQPIKVQTRRVSDNRLLRQVDTTYATRTTATPDVQFPYVSSRVEKAYALIDGRLLSTQTTTNSLVDAYGNIGDTTVVLQDHENSQTFQTQTTQSFTIDDSWANWRVGQVASTTTKAWLNGSNDPSKDRQMAFTYDASTGLLLTETREPGKGAGIELTTTMAYDAVGNVISETLSGPGMTTRSNTVSYGADYHFPDTVTNALGHTMDQTWDAALGVQLSQTDANNQTTTWTYNGFGMREQETRPDGTTTDTDLYTCDPLNTMCASLGATSYVQTLVSGAAPVRTYYDQLGRTVRTRSQAFDGGRVNQDTQYDALGRAYRASEPFFDGDPVVWNTQTFDYLDRVTALTAADPTASGTTSYDGYEVSITDAASRTETRAVNAAGQVIQVVDKAGTTMTFAYDPVGNRKQVNNAVGLAQSSSVYYTYDRLGRMLSQHDPDHGVYTYTYDTLGNKLTEISPKLAASSQSISYQYDLLNRMTSRTEPEGTTTWTYDGTTGGSLGLGRLASESQSGFSRSYTYGPGDYGRLTDTTTVIGSQSYTTSASYDAYGRVHTETWPASAAEPGGFEVEYVYSPVGMLEVVQSVGGGSVYYQLLDTDAAGRLTSEWMGDGSTVTQAYDGYSSRIASQESAQGATTIQHFTYGYDSSGNMLSRTDARQTLTEAFTFDTLDRLTSAQVGTHPTANYDFDVTGSMTEKSDVGLAYLYTGTQPHAVTQITQSGGQPPNTFGYDANGNMDVVDGSPMITWSSYNKPTQIASGGITYNFSYGPDRKRFKKTRNGTITHYVGTSFETIDPGLGIDTYRHYIRANGKTIMTREDVAGTVSHRYVHRDHLGSVTAITDETTGNVIERYSYDAWGVRRSALDWQSSVTSTIENRGYTGHEHLDDVGVIHMNGRIYSPSLGRMLSPDPVTQAPENGQNYNRYTYTLNNPLRYTDPSGYCIDPFDTSSSGFIPCPPKETEFTVVEKKDPAENTPKIVLGDELSLGDAKHPYLTIGLAKFVLDSSLPELKHLVDVLYFAASLGLYNDILNTMEREVLVHISLGDLPGNSVMNYRTKGDLLVIDLEKLQVLTAADKALTWGHELVHIRDRVNGDIRNQFSANLSEWRAYQWQWEHRKIKRVSAMMRSAIFNGKRKYRECWVKRNSSERPKKCLKKM